MTTTNLSAVPTSLCNRNLSSPACNGSVSNTAATNGSIAVVGVAGRFPESNSVNEFMQNLYSGRDLITTDDRRWPAGIYGIPERHGQLKDIESLDAAFFRIHGAQAEKMDPQLRLLLSATYEALNDAGLNPSAMRGSRTGVYVGACFSDSHDYLLRDASKIIGYENTGCAHSMFANRLSFAFDWNGPSFVVDTACSSSMVAFAQACQGLERGDCEVAIVGGVSITLRPEVNLAFKKLGMLSPDGACKSFDTGANGYCRSECVGVAVLTRVANGAPQVRVLPSPVAHPQRSLADMQLRHVYATVRGFGCNNDGFTAKGITFPSVEAQTALNFEVLQKSGLSASDIGYIEAHGTGTNAGDGVEIRALDAVYGKPGVEGGRKSLLLGSVKSNMGHAEGAAGIASLIKVVSAFERNVLPPNLHYQNGNTVTDALSTGRMVVPTTPTDISHVRAAAISSFGFGGTNAHVILERNMDAQVTNRVLAPVVAPQLELLDGQKVALLSSPPALAAVEGEKPAAASNVDASTVAAPVIDGHRRNTSSVASVADSTFGDLDAALLEAPAASAGASAEKKPYETLGFRVPEWLLERLPALTYARTIEGAEKIAQAAAAAPIEEVRRGLPAGMPSVLGAPVFEDSLEWLQTTYPARATLSKDGKIDAAAVSRPAFTDDSSTVQSGRPVWIAFTGNGGMWPGMGSDLYKVSSVFRAVLDESFAIGDKVGCDLRTVCLAAPEDALRVAKECTAATAMMSQVALQIGLLEMLTKELGLAAGGFMGHSAGEIAAAYFDGCVTLEQAVLVAFHRNIVIEDAKLGPGHMYAAGLSREDAERLIKEGGAEGKVVVGCHNDPSGVTLSGEAAAVDAIAAKLDAQGVFCRKVETKGVAHHSPMLGPLYDELIRRLDTLIPAPKARSAKWISTCCVPTRSARDVEVEKTASSHYFGWNFIHAVEWVQALQAVPKGAVILEVGPHALLASPTKRTRPDLLYIPTMKKGELGSETFAQAFAALWRSGALDRTLALAHDAHATDKLITPGIRLTDATLREALMQWDFSAHFPVMSHFDAAASSNAGFTVNFLVGTNGHDDETMLDHVIDGKPLIPAAAYVQGCWQALAMSLNVPADKMDTCPVQLEDFKIHQATQVDAKAAPEKVAFKVMVVPASGNQRAISLLNESGELIASCVGTPLMAESESDANRVKGVLAAQAAHVATLEDEVRALHPALVEAVLEKDAEAAHPDVLGRNAFYTAIRSRGYEYGPFYRPVARIDADATVAALEFNPRSRWAALVDGLLQCLITPKPDARGPEVSGTLCVPTRIAKVVIRPDVLAEQQAAGEELRSLAVIEPWNMSVACRWASVEGLEMKPVKRQDPEVTKHALSAERTVALKGAFPVLTAASAEAGAVVDAALEFIEHNEANYDLNALELLPAGELPSAAVTLTAALRPTVNSLKTLLLAAPQDEAALNEAAKAIGVSVPEAFDAKNAPAKQNVVLLRNPSAADETLQQALAAVAAKYIVVHRAAAAAAFSAEGYETLASFETPLAVVEVLVRPAEVSGQVTLIRTSRADLESAERFDAWKAALMAAKEGRVILVAAEDSGIVGLWRCLRKEGFSTTRALVLPTVEDVNALCSELSSVASTASPAVAQALRLESVGILVVKADGSEPRTVLHTALPAAGEESVDASAVAIPAYGCYITFERPGDLSSAIWVPVERGPEPDECVVDVRASALNFKDVMLAYGKIDASAFYGRVPPKSVGFELSGLERGTGRRVMGFSDDALATAAFSRQELLWTIPEAWSFEEAATVPVVYATAYYALFIRGELDKRGEKPSVLIHAAAGGVGQAATRIALNRGCEVFVTCSKGKREAVQKLFPQLPATHILDSRSTSFERGVMRLTKGRGVDLVLNSLSEDKLQASTRVVAQHGAFLEIGKFDIMERSKLDLHLLVKNVAVHGIDVDQVRFDARQWSRTHALVAEGLASGEVVPLGFASFKATEVTDMFRYMAEGLHTGKVILNLNPSEELDNIQRTAAANNTRLVLEDSTAAQIIIGGLGGFGLGLAWFLAERGARRIFLVGRGGVARGEQAMQLACMKEKFGPSLKVEVVKGDAAKPEDCERLVSTVLEQCPRIGGVFNLAMVLQDALFENAQMDGQRWMRSINPKVAATDNLLAALEARGLVKALDHFVTFSSVAAGLGNAGQTNYAWANSHMDATAKRLSAQGSKLLSVQWGTIGDVGVAARQLDGGFLEDVLAPQALASCLHTLERLIAEKRFGVSQSYMLPKRQEASASNMSPLDAVLAVLRMPREGLRGNATLEGLGMDSMQAVEVQTALRRTAGLALPVAKIQQLTIDELAAL